MSGRRGQKRRQNGVQGCIVEGDIRIGVGERWGQDCECMPYGEMECDCHVGDIRLSVGEKWGHHCECTQYGEVKCDCLVGDIIVRTGEKWGEECLCMPSGELQCGRNNGCVMGGDILIGVGESPSGGNHCQCTQTGEVECENNGKYFLSLLHPRSPLVGCKS